MIVSTDDYSYLRTATWQSELSRKQVFEMFPDKRSWWIDSSGEVFDAGSDHDQFVKDHPELFDHDEGDSTYYAVRKMWVRVSAWGPSFTINSRNITNKQLDAAQILYMREGEGKKVEFFQEGVIPTSFDKEEFLELKNVNQLKRLRNRFSMLLSSDYVGLRIADSPSDYMKQQHPDKRSWWINPEGRVFDAGHDHVKFLEERPKTFGKFADINKALTMDWVRVAFWGGEYVVHGHMIRRAQLEASQVIYKEMGGEHKVFISTLNKSGYISPHDFIWADSQTDLLRNLFSDPTGIRRFSGSRKASGSEWMKRQFPDKRSWWISPDGKVLDAGHNHDKFVRQNPGIFHYMTEHEEIIGDGWVSVGSYGDEFVINANRLTGQQLSVAQELYHETSKPYAYIVTPQRYGKLPKDEFLQAGSFVELMKALRTSFSATASRRAGPLEDRSWVNDRAWLISPDNKVISCGEDHEKFILDNRELFRGMGYNIDSSYQLVKDGWARIGTLGPMLYLDSNQVTNFYFNKLKELTKKLEYVKRVKINDRFIIDRRDFLSMDDPIELRWIPEVASRRRSGSLPKSRNFLMGISLDDLSWPLRQAFDLLKLSKKKDKLSANQVASEFQANDEFLQDHVNRTATELIRDLNGFFQYGLQQQIA